MEDDPIKYLAFDPGYTTGYAFFHKSGKPHSTDQLTFNQMIKTLNNLAKVQRSNDEKLVFIIEDFQLLRHKASAMVGSRFEVCQIIGALKLTAELMDADCHIQEPTIKNAASGWTGIKPLADHKNGHWVDAQLHGFYYLIKNDILSVSQVRSEDWTK